MKPLKNTIFALAVSALAFTSLACSESASPTAPLSTCSNPAPLLTVPNPRADSYTVFIQDNLELGKELPRLEARHGFRSQAKLVTSHGAGFAATLGPQTLATISCDSAVKQVFQNPAL